MHPIRLLLPAIVLWLAGCGAHDTQVLNGYVEEEPVRVSSPVGGRLLAYTADRGDTVQAGQPLFTLEQEDERAGVVGAQARVQQAVAQASDLATGKRPDEVATTEDALRQAQASLRQAESDLARQTALARSGFTSGADLDALTAQRDRDAAQVAQMEAQVRVDRLAGRDQERAAAQANARAAQADLAQREWALDQKSVRAPVSARVEDRYYRPGEWVPAGSPVFSLLAPDAVKIRFYVPETRLAEARPGTTVHVACDGCGAPIAAQVRFVARDAEFTPPVIYSKENRDKLVYLVEAWPQAADAPRLRPGQPVDVSLEGVR